MVCLAQEPNGHTTRLLLIRISDSKIGQVSVIPKYPKNHISKSIKIDQNSADFDDLQGFDMSWPPEIWHTWTWHLRYGLWQCLAWIMCQWGMKETKDRGETNKHWGLTCWRPDWRIVDAFTNDIRWGIITPDRHFILIDIQQDLTSALGASPRDRPKAQLISQLRVGGVLAKSVGVETCPVCWDQSLQQDS